MASFPGGVRSPDGSIGVVHVTSTELVAVNLTSGSQIWRTKSAGRPVAATDRNLVVLEPGADRLLRIYDLHTGVFKGTVGAELPDWIDDRDVGEALVFSASQSNSDLSVEWKAEPRYRGGAAPRKEDVEKPPEAGRITIDTITLQSVQSRIESVATPSSPELERSAATAQAPVQGEVARSVAGDRQYVLRTEDDASGGQTIKLDAMDEDGETKFWEVELGRVDLKRGPGPLRK